MGNVAKVAIEAYADFDRPLKYHEEDMLSLMRETFDDITGSVLDIGCADALFLDAVGRTFPNAQLEGVDLSEELVARCKERFEGRDAKFSVADAGNIQSDDKYQAIIASGIVTCFDNQLETLEQWLSLLEDDGALFLFGRFNSRPVHSKFYIKEIGSDEWTEPRTSYYIGTIKGHFEAQGYSVDFKPFELPIELEEKPNPLSTYTVIDKANGQKHLLSGANVIVEAFHGIIKRKT